MTGGGKPNARLLLDARREAERLQLDAPLNADPAAVLQAVLDKLVAQVQHAEARCDELTEDEFFVPTAQGTLPHHWIRYRDGRLQELERVAHNALRNGLAERVLQLKEAEAALYIGALRDAAIEAGIPNDQVRALGAALRRRLARSDDEVPAAIEGSAEPLARAHVDPQREGAT